MEAEAKEREALASKTHGKEALNHAIAAAEIYMKAARQSSSAAEKSRFKKKCEEMISMAERLKISPRTDSVAAVEKRLKLPRSSRQIPTSEKNILLRGSRLHGNVFPPWESDPDPREFNGPPFIDPSEFPLSERQSEVFAGWKRPLELTGNDSRPGETQIRSRRLMESSGDYDLVQDITTDCSVVASLCASIRRLKPGPASILPALMFPIDFGSGRPEISASGKYIFRMYFNGCFRKVVIDDRLPSSRNDRTLYVVDRQNPDLVWPALVEKAYLKVRGGYDFPGSNSGTDLWVLTGWIPQQIFLQSDDVDCDQTWRRIKKAYDYGDVVVTLGTGRLSLDEEEILGLAGEHDYAVLDISEASGSRKLLVKNPWCDGLVWKGVGSFAETSSPPPDASSEQQQQQEHPIKLKPGMFWISFDDVAQNFESLYLNWNPSLFTERQDHHFTWQLPEPNMIHSFAHNPQYSMTAAQAGGSTWILLSRHFQDAELDIARGGGGGSGGGGGGGGGGDGGSGGGSSGDGGRSTTLASVSNKLGFMSLYIFESPNQSGGESERVLLPDDRSVVYRGPFVDSPQTLAPFEARRGARYTVAVASQDLPLPRYSFTLSFFSRAPLEIHPARDGALAHHAEEQAAWTRRTAGGNAASPTYGLNPQFRLRLLPPPPSPPSPPHPSATTTTTTTTTAAAAAAGPVSLLLSTARDDLPIRIDVVWAGGRRIAAPVPQRDLVASSGDEYRRGGCAVARSARVEPGDYTVVCSTFDAGQLAGFALRVASALPCSLEPLPPDAAGRLRVRLPDLVFRSSGNNSNSNNNNSRGMAAAAAAWGGSDGGGGGGSSGGGSSSSSSSSNETTRFRRRTPIYATRLTRASVVVTRRDSSFSSSFSSSSSSSSYPPSPYHPHQHQHPHQSRTRARNPTVRLRLVYGSGPNRTILAATGGGGSGGGGGGGGGEFREVGPGGLRTPEFDVEPRRGTLWLVAEQIGGGGGGQEGGQTGLQVEILCDAAVQVGAWEVVDA